MIHIPFSSFSIVSGPKRFEWDAIQKDWLDVHTGEPLSVLVTREMSHLMNKVVEFKFMLQS
jgi:frataxin-like iron-binding protein CyaY